MSKVDRAKEQIAYLKLWLGILIAATISHGLAYFKFPTGTLVACCVRHFILADNQPWWLSYS